jgi:hypothetical protein
MTHLSRKSDPRPLPPLSAEEAGSCDRLVGHVAQLAGRIGERNLWHYQALSAAADYIGDTLAALGYRPADEPYLCRGIAVHNLVAEKRGALHPEDIVVLGAHYDSVHGSPGANDNGSGVAALLELARVLAREDLPCTVRYVAFVNEEQPFAFSPEMGSLVHARAARARGDRIRAMLSLETIGYYSDAPGSQQYPFPLSRFYPERAHFIGFVGNLRSRALVWRALRAFRRHSVFPSESAALPGWVTGVGWSDHWSFWQAGYPAIMVTDTAFFRYPYYHSAGDTPERIDYARMARVVAGLAGVVRELAGKATLSGTRSAARGRR